jgi:peptidoglycan/LPS O-acetylase OafA/YrhL
MAKKKISIMDPGDRKVNVSQNFVIALAIVSVIGFIGIISSTLFGKDISNYVEALWMFVIGIGLVIEARVKKLKSLGKGLTPGNFTNLTTVLIGIIAILAGIFSFPGIRIENPGFLAVKGILSIIAIAVILIQILAID